MSANTPKHYGFAQVPRQILRGEKYKKKISLAEKGLYSCLKDICGDRGECYYSLRNLALEIGTSASTLTRLIPQLRDVGIIYAEKKVRGTGENKHEIWHIRIVDIWQENDALYRSQDCSILKQSDEKIVSNRNNVVDAPTSVSNCNNCVSNCNNDCFILLANEYLDSNDNLTKEDKEESITDGAKTPALAPVVASSFVLSLSSQEETKPPSKKKEKKTEPVEPKGPPQMPPADMAWGTHKCLLKFDAWRGCLLIANYKLQQASKCAKGLADQYREEDVDKVYKLMNDDPYWIGRGGADICDVANNIHKEIKKVKNQKQLVIHSAQTETRPSFLVSEEQKQKNIGKLHALAAAKAAKE
jgi:hypothetical protein